MGVWEFRSLGVWTIAYGSLDIGLWEFGQWSMRVWEFRSLGVWTIAYGSLGV